MRPVFENADGIILRGPDVEDFQKVVPEDALVAVATFEPDQVRVARAKYRPANGFVRLGELIGMPGDTDCQLQWQRNVDVDLDSLQPVIIGGRTHYTTG